MKAKLNELGVVVLVCNLSPCKRLRQEDYYKLKASLDDTVSSGQSESQHEIFVSK